MLLRRHVCALALALAACGAQSVEPAVVPATPALNLPVDGCVGAAPDPGRPVVRALSRREYDNTVADLLGDTTAPARFFSPDADGLAFDADEDGARVSPLLVEQYQTAAENLSSRARLDRVFGCDLVRTPDCARNFVTSFGLRAFRRPLTTADAAPYQRLFDAIRAQDGTESAARAVISAMLQSPRFLYRLELSATQPSAQASPLDDYDLASRLSYLLWGSMPDAALFDAAAHHRLATAPQLADQARRMLKDPRAHRVVAAFHRQWLGLDDLDELMKDPARFPNFAQLAPLFRAETDAFLERTFWDDGDASHLFRSSYAYWNGPLADFYGLPGPTGDAFRWVTPNGARKGGLLTQGALLSLNARADQSSPVLRGKFVREQLFCEELPPPPPNVTAQLPPPTSGTTRDRQSQHASDKNCSGCHALMDPIGFGFENYDAVGAFRLTENGARIDASGQIIGSEDVAGPFDGADALSQKLSTSRTVKHCLARQWFHFAYGRADALADACTLHALDVQFERSGWDLRELLVALTQTDAFRYRRASP